MGFIQNQNLTLDLSREDVIYWESTPQPPSAAANNTIIALGVLTFALQLCFVLLFLLRCWRFDSRVQEALKHPDSTNKLSEFRLFHGGISKQPSYSLCNDACDASSSKMSAAVEKYEHTTVSMGPSIPWDLVQ